MLSLHTFSISAEASQSLISFKLSFRFEIDKFRGVIRNTKIAELIS